MSIGSDSTSAASDITNNMGPQVQYRLKFLLGRMLHPGYLRKILWGRGGGEREYWVPLGVVETIVGVGFIHCLFNLLY